MIERPRLIPAVILGAIGLLALKGIGWVTMPANAPVAGTSVPSKNPADYKGFVKLVTTAHQPDRFLDPDTTGSVPDKKPDAETAAATKDEAKRQAQNAPKDRAAVMNGAERPLSASERALLERLGERREEIEARSRELELREKLLETVEKKVEGRVGELKQIEERLGEGKDKKDQAEQQGLKNLVVMYETMKPKDAARIFDRLGMDVLLPVVQQMNPRKMSEVLAAMSPEAAEKLTVAMAQRAKGTTERGATLVSQPGLPATELPAIVPPRQN